MSEWWTYRLDDFLLFSPRVYWRMFELQNGTLCPLALGLVLLGAVLAVLAWRGSRPPLVLACLALLWLWVGWSFVWQRYAVINWAIAYAVPLFGVQAALLLAAMRLPVRPVPAARGLGMVLAVLGVAAYPFLAPSGGRPLAGAELFGTAPDPTAIGTLGLILALGARPVWLLLPIPLLWCVVSWLTLWTMDEAQAWVPLAAAAGGLAGVLGFRTRRASS